MLFGRLEVLSEFKNSVVVELNTSFFIISNLSIEPKFRYSFSSPKVKKEIEEVKDLKKKEKKKLKKF